MPVPSKYLSVFRLFLLLLLTSWPKPASAQLPAHRCEWGTARTELNVNKVIATLRNTGSFPREFLKAPAETPSLAIEAHSLWVGGRVGNDIRIAGSQYGPYEFFPGPLDEAGNPPTDCTPFDRIYTVSRTDIERYDSLEVATPDLRDWPWQLGADVIDGDGTPDNYNLAGGDRPRLFGEQTAFWIMNDRGNTHLWARTEPIGLEVRAYAFGFANPSKVFSDTIPFDAAYLSNALSGTVFFRYLITYKGDEPFEEAYLGLWSDVILGPYGDYSGCDTTLHLAYGYDKDHHRHPLWDGRPPAVGVALLQGPTVRRSGGTLDTLGMTNFMDIRPVDDGPRHGTLDAYLFMQSRWYWEGGSPVTYGNGGRGGDTPTKFMYPGDPVTGAFWSMENLDGHGTKHSGNDVRLALGSGPFRMEPGQTQEIVYAVIWAQGMDRLDSISELRASTQGIRAVYRDHIVAEIPDTVAEIPDVAPPSLVALSSNYPNPFDGQTEIRYALPKASHVSLIIYDVLGRQRATLVNRRQSSGIHRVPFDASSLPAGVYTYRFILDGYLTGTGTMVRVR